MADALVSPAIVLGNNYDIDIVRVVRIGDYDECLCAGTHVAHTAEIGTFRISSSRYQDGVQRIVFKLEK